MAGRSSTHLFTCGGTLVCATSRTIGLAKERSVRFRCRSTCSSSRSAIAFWRHGIEQRAEIDARARELISKYDIRTPGPNTPVARLSGGNIQKVLLARELADGAKVVIFNKPTYGLDLANALATRKRIQEIAASGKGVLLISTDLEELLGLCDRIAVMARGRIVGTVENGDNARTDVGRLMVGLAA